MWHLSRPRQEAGTIIKKKKIFRLNKTYLNFHIRIDSLYNHLPDETDFLPINYYVALLHQLVYRMANIFRSSFSVS